jgi:GT2 family glycosyltransferase
VSARAAIGTRRAVRRTRSAWGTFAGEVEPGQLAVPRVHRARMPAIVGPASTPPAAVAVAVDASGGGDAAATRASLERQTVAPAAVVDGGTAVALGATRAEWVVTVAAGDLLADVALERLGQAASQVPAAGLITADDDAFDTRGVRVDPRLRPGPSPDLFAHRDPDYVVAARRHDRLHTRPGSTGHAHVPMVLAHRAAGPPRPHLATAPAGGPPPAPVLRGEPHVEAIICFRDRPELLERAARSLLEVTDYARLTLHLVDNGSTDARSAVLVRKLGADPRVTLVRDERPFNFSALNDAAALRSDADVLLLLNNDTEVVEPGWLAPLVAHTQREDVGAVGPLLTFRDGRVQHAGVALGIHGWAGHPFAGLRPERRTPFGAALDGPREWTAITAACLVVERRKYLAAGGLDPAFAVGGGDVDLCLRLGSWGWRSLCVPSVRVIHDESASRDPLAVTTADHAASRRSYGAMRTAGDPCYHPALTLAATDCSPRAPGEEDPF